jgi:integrase
MYRIGGQKQRMTLGRYPMVSLSEAREHARRVLGDVTSGSDPKGPRQESIDDRSFGSVMERFVAEHCRVHNRASTARETERILKHDFVTRWRTRPLETITSQDVRAVLQSIRDDARPKPSAANHALGAIRKFFNWCLEQELLTASPCTNVRRPSPLSQRDRVLTDEELGLVWNACAGTEASFGRIVRLLILTAQRRGEVTGLRWLEIDFEQALWTIPGSYPTKASSVSGTRKRNGSFEPFLMLSSRACRAVFAAAMTVVSSSASATHCPL